MATITRSTVDPQQKYTYDNLKTTYAFPSASGTNVIQRLEYAPKDTDGLGYLNNTTGGYTNGETFPNRADSSKYTTQPVGKFNHYNLVYNTDGRTRYGATAAGAEILVTVATVHQP